MDTIRSVRIHGGIAPASKADGIDQGTLRYRYREACRRFNLEPTYARQPAGATVPAPPTWLERIAEWILGRIRATELRQRR